MQPGYDPLLERIEAEIAARGASALGRNDAEALRLEGSLIDFVEAAWPSIDPAEYQPNWAVEGLCEHLQAVADGHIKRCLVNFPPRASKTLVTSVCFRLGSGRNASGRTYVVRLSNSFAGLMRIR